MPHLRSVLILTSVCLAANLACDGDPTGPDVAGPPALLNIVAGNDQSGTVGAELPDPLVVQVTDAAGRPVPGQILNFRVVSGGGSVFAGAAQTNEEGRAQERWTLGTVARDTQRVEVRAVDPGTGAPVVFATFRAVGQPGPAADMQKASTDSAAAVVGGDVTPLPRVRVLDQYGNPVSGVAVTFTPTSGGGTVTGESQTTDEAGYAVVGGWTLGTGAGAQSLTATAAGNTPLSLTFTAFAVAAAATQLVIEQPASGAQAGIPFAQQPRIRLHDAHGNLVPNASEPVTVSVSSGADVIGEATVTPSGGIAAFTNAGLSGAVGSYVLTYSANVTDGSVTQPVSLSAGAAADLQVHVAAAGASGDVPFTTQPAVRIVDSSGNLVSGATHAVTIAVVTSGGSIIGTPTATAVQGVASFSDVGVSGPPGTYALSYSASIAGAARTVTQSIDVDPGSAALYVVSSSADSVEVGAPVTIAAQLADAAGTAVARAGIAVSWSRSGAAGTFASATSTTNSAGVATVVFTPDTVFTSSTTTISAADGNGRSGSLQVGVRTGAPAKLAFVDHPTNGGYLITLPAVTVAIKDRYGNAVASDARQVQLQLASNPGGATLAGGEPTASVEGTATFSDLTVNRAGTGYTLSATSPGLQSATSTAFDVSAIGIVTSTSATLGDLYVTHGQVFYTAWGVGVPQGIYTAKSTGGPGSLLTSPGSSCSTTGIFGDAQYLYYPTFCGYNYRSLRIYRLPLGGTTAVAIHGGAGGYLWQLRAIAFDGQHFYYSGTGSPDIDSGTMRVDVPNGEAMQLLPQARGPLAAADGMLYFVQDSAIKAIPIQGGTETTIATGVRPPSMIVVNGNIYWPESSTSGVAIRSVSVSGGTVATRATGLTAVTGPMVSDGTHLYVNDATSIRRYDLATFGMTTIVDNDAVYKMALHGESVYWTSNPTYGLSFIKKARR